MTIDQWLIIRCIIENPDISQQEMGEIVFKDNASVTRMIELLVKARYLVRQPNDKDRRRVNLVVTDDARIVIEKMHDVVVRNRRHALNGISSKDIESVNRILGIIIENCRKD